MGKYEPLGQFLRKQKAKRVAMSFADIERIIGTALPRSKLSRAFWSNNSDNNVMTKEWIEAGFRTSEVNTESGRLVFVRAPDAGDTPGKSWDSVFGCMKGMFTIEPGYDLTLPTGEDWVAEDVDGIETRNKS